MLVILYSFEGFDKSLSAWLMLFCAERFISVVCLLPIILCRDNGAFIVGGNREWEPGSNGSGRSTGGGRRGGGRWDI